AAKGFHHVCERIEPDGHKVERRPGDLTTEMAVKQAGEFMRTGARGSPSWPGRKLMGRIHCSRLLGPTGINPLADRGRAIHSVGTERRNRHTCANFFFAAETPPTVPKEFALAPVLVPHSGVGLLSLAALILRGLE